MKALELLLNQESILLENSIESKKMQSLVSNFNKLMLEMNKQINEFDNFSKSQLKGEYGEKIIVAKSLAKFFENNKNLKVEGTVVNLKNEENAKVNQYYSAKTKLLENIKTIIKESAKEALISAYDIFDGDFVKCPEGHEIIILGKRNQDILSTLLNELDTELIIHGNFENIQPQDVDYNIDTLNRNIELLTRKNTEINGTRPSKGNKITILIDRFLNISHKVVAFYTYKSSLEVIGCPAKGIKDYESELNKVYIPLKKTLQKELRVELEDITAVVEEEYEFKDIEETENNIPATMENLEMENFDNLENTENTDNLENTENTDNTDNPENTNNAETLKTTESTEGFDNLQIPTESINEDTFVEPTNFDNFTTETYNTFEQSMDNIETSRLNDPFQMASETVSNPFEVNISDPFNQEIPNPFDTNVSNTVDSIEPSIYSNTNNDVTSFQSAETLEPYTPAVETFSEPSPLYEEPISTNPFSSSTLDNNFSSTTPSSTSLSDALSNYTSSYGSSSTFDSLSSSLENLKNAYDSLSNRLNNSNLTSTPSSFDSTYNSEIKPTVNPFDDNNN